VRRVALVWGTVTASIVSHSRLSRVCWQQHDRPHVVGTRVAPLSRMHRVTARMHHHYAGRTMGTHIGVTHRELSAVREIEGGSTTEAIGGAAAIVLGILGLLGILPISLASVAAIAVGAGLIAAGGTIAGRYERVLLGAGTEPTATRREIAGGLGMEAVAGAAAIVLGILALLGKDSMTLLAVAAIAVGAGLLMASGSMARLESLIRWEFGRNAESRANEMIYASAGSEVIVGVGAIVLGILALVGFDPVTLTLVAILSIGASLLLSGSSVAGRFFTMFH